MKIPFLSLTFCFATFALGAAVLLKDEVEALREIAKTLGKTDWNFNGDPCSGGSGWVDPVDGSKENNLTCDCSFSSGTMCHVVSIILKGQNLAGTLPPDFAGLPYLQNVTTHNRDTTCCT
ncbi:probable LRR receptor-like serine/threonine-protein kinase At1g07650 [Corylus avellana]|uniref:probable LRR receptor-like serine/threonine-protein kinase At1g07650 n=1 Tax=Corylus avellana TaxID=13451 RepID=UPI00286CAAF5|nr:probable LRR receptor-like serine/threonine-protein kinase At1g07650 [Corylus avellana]